MPHRPSPFSSIQEVCGEGDSTVLFYGKQGSRNLKYNQKQVSSTLVESLSPTHLERTGGLLTGCSLAPQWQKKPPITLIFTSTPGYSVVSQTEIAQIKT